jgi:hypothetical protein
LHVLYMAGGRSNMVGTQAQVILQAADVSRRHETGAQQPVGVQRCTPSAGNAALMTAELKGTLCEHAMGNYRILAGLGSDLLSAAAQRDLAQVDEKLYLEIFAPSKSAGAARAMRSR